MAHKGKKKKKKKEEDFPTWTLFSKSCREDFDFDEVF